MTRFPLTLYFFRLLLLLVAIGSVPAQQIPKHVREETAREATDPSKRGLYDEVQLATEYWYDSRNPKNLPAMDEALESILPEALKLSPSVTKFVTWEAAQKVKPYHDAGAVLLAKAYTLLYYGRVREATPVIGLIEKKFPYSMALFKYHRTVLRVRERLRFHEHACAVYAAIRFRKAEALTFPSERDEFDGWAQREALKNMAILRLREGDFESVDHYFTAINKSGLQTSSGDWAIRILYDAMMPFDPEAWSSEAWKEALDAMRLWQKKKPDSMHAKLAEARLALHYAWHAVSSGGSEAYADFRERVTHGLSIIRDIPKTSPAWYDTTVGLMLSNGERIDTVAPVFKEGLLKYPDYTPLAYTLADGLVRSGEQGRQACAEMIRRYSTGPDAHVGGQLLRHLMDAGLLSELQPRLDMDAVETVVETALAAWPHGLDLRSDLGLVSVSLSQQKLARVCLAGMRGKWNRNTWQGREDIAERLSSTPAQIKAVNVPAKSTPSL
jgi:Domain of unknown function (DUF4034)